MTLPTPGSDYNTHGTTLNAHLNVSLAADGKIKDGAAQSSSAAPTADAQVANKKYVDDLIAAYVALSAYTTLDSNNEAMLKAHAYKAQTDGSVFVRMSLAQGKYLIGYVGTTDDPVGAGTVIQNVTASTAEAYCISFEVAKDEYFEITTDDAGAPGIRWKSRGTLSKPIDQD